MAIIPYASFMALIRTLEKGTSNIKPHRSKVDATFQIIYGADGEPLLHIATYGSDDRLSEPKVSQTIQIDKKTALSLANIIDKEFNK